MREELKRALLIGLAGVGAAEEERLELIYLRKQGLITPQEWGVAMGRLDRMWVEATKPTKKEKRS